MLHDNRPGPRGWLLMLVTILGILSSSPVLRECPVPATAESDEGRTIQTLTPARRLVQGRTCISRAMRIVTGVATLCSAEVELAS